MILKNPCISNVLDPIRNRVSLRPMQLKAVYLVSCFPTDRTALGIHTCMLLLLSMLTMIVSY